MLRKRVLCWWYQQCRKVQQSSELAQQNAASDFKSCHSDAWERVLMLLAFACSLIIRRFKHLSHVLSVTCCFMSPDCSFIGILFISLSLLKTCAHIKLLVLYCWSTLGTFSLLGSWPLVFSFFPCDIYLLGILLVLFFNVFFCLLVGWIFDFCLFVWWKRLVVLMEFFVIVIWLVWFEHTKILFLGSQICVYSK